MRGFLFRWALSSLSLWVAAAVVPGMHIEGFSTLVLAALILGVVNALVRPIVVVLTLPLTIVTLGLFLLVVNTAMLGLVAKFLSGFTISGFWAAFFGSLIVSLVGSFLSWMIGPKGNVEMMVVRKR